jgi:hypothetical protein
MSAHQQTVPLLINTNASLDDPAELDRPYAKLIRAKETDEIQNSYDIHADMYIIIPPDLTQIYVCLMRNSMA